MLTAPTLYSRAASVRLGEPRVVLGTHACVALYRLGVVLLMPLTT